MTIHPLSANTARLLRASAVVISPTSVIKELVDNAIDAKATSVRIQISRNTIDVIEVRDNGDGIDSNDFQALGRRAHTSKLRTFQELPRIGATSLGFRGEALASINTCSDITVITRTARDPVGHHIRLITEGGGAEQRTTSSPVGTTIRIANLFGNLPVRRQTAVKASLKSQSDIRRLLQVYSLTRPYLRILFKVTGDDTASWSYSPTSPPTIEGATLQCFGKSLASQCNIVQVVESASCPNKKLVEELTSVEVSRIEIEAFLPRRESKPSEICNRGAFISVDSRPLAAQRGTPKKILIAYKAHLESCLKTEGHRLSNPFIRLNIRCPPGIYDVNISPAKDEVIFTDEARVLEVVNQMLKEYYKPEQRAERSAEPGDILSPEDLLSLECLVEKDDIYSDILESPCITASASLLHPSRRGDGDDRPINFDPTAANHSQVISIWNVDMSIDQSEEEGARAQDVQYSTVVDLLHRGGTKEGTIGAPTSSTQHEEINSESNIMLLPDASNVLEENFNLDAPPEIPEVNPWTLAIQSAKARRGELRPANTHEDPRFSCTEIPVWKQLPRQAEQLILHEEEVSPSGSDSLRLELEQLASKPMMWPSQALQWLQTPPPLPARRNRAIITGSQRQFRPSDIIQPKGSGGSENLKVMRQFLAPRRIGAQGYDWSHPSHNSKRRPKIVDQDPASCDSLLQEADNLLGTFPHFIGTCWRGDEQNQKLETIQQADSLSKPTSMIAERSWTKVSPRNASTEIKYQSESSILVDSRACSMERRRSVLRDRQIEEGTMSCLRSHILPLETISINREMHNVIIRVNTSIDMLEREVSLIAGIDSYVVAGECHSGMPTGLTSASEIQDAIQSAFGKWAQRQTGSWHDLKLDLRGQLKGKGKE
ncbi:hypothetical protein jhhlp_002373 [Lomentospora prolificans]|uniref:DNA mismatch repair protein S5 domain-containing protein n=1 Tax=Lomentospora prolificans TaxID=41688 RepID=A0A2N3NDW5_9PEZI|nr:hypothetical protein jhhlp_002373 [Lomentospora prolificans]